MKVRVYQDNRGEWRWTLLSRNGRKIGAASEGYRARHRATSNLHIVTGLRVSIHRSHRGEYSTRVWRVAV